MFDLLPSAPASGLIPWNVSLEKRTTALFSRPRRVAWLYDRPDTSTFRYRVFNMVEALQADPEKRISATWFSGDELDGIIPFVSELDVIVVARFCYGAALHRVVSRARRFGVKIVFESDDLVFDIDYARIVLESLGQNAEDTRVWESWFAYIGRLNASLKLCDGGITTNSYLGSRMGHALAGKNVAVIPNFLNREQQAFSEALLAAKQESGWRRSGDITIGYFSGSPTHNRDFAVAAPAIARILKKYSDVRLRVVGFLDETGPVGAFRDRVEILPLMSYISLQKAIAEVEINIAPLQDNVFTNCKSELKFFEAAAVGTWTIASPTFTFRSAINDKATGRLARAHEWDVALEEALELVRDSKAYATCASIAARDTYATYGWDRQVATIIDALNPYLEQKNQ